MEKKERKQKRGRIKASLPYILMILLGGCIGVFAGKYGDKLHISGQSLLVFLAVLIIAMYLQVIIHEAGHLVMGLCSGYKFISFRIESFMWVKIDGKVRLKRYSLMGTGGQCLLEPPEMKDGYFPVKLYNAGGVLFNLLTAGIFGILAVMTQFIPIVSFASAIIALTGMLYAILNGIPMRIGAIDNDGYNMIHMGKNADALKNFWLQLQMNAQTTKGVRIKDMPEEWFVIPSKEEMQNPLGASNAVFACNRAIDQKDFQKARELCKMLLEEESGILPLHKYIIISEHIFCELIGENRSEEIEKWRTKEFAKYEKSMKNYPSLIRMQYAYELFHNQDEQMAGKKLELFEKVKKTYPYEADIQGEWELIQYVKEQYEKMK